MDARVGDIVRLKQDCLGNPKGTAGIVYWHYGDGFQVIFKNGNYDGFSLKSKMQGIIEAEYFLEMAGHNPNFETYSFINVMKLSRDYDEGLFDSVFKNNS